jgi:FtsH-binding integral membrane protein
MVNSSLYERFFNLSGGQKGGKPTNLNLLNILFQKKQLLVMIFANLIVQFGITYYVFSKTNSYKIKGTIKFFIIIGLFALLLTIGLLPMPSWLKFILFCLFSYLQGLFLSTIKTVANQQMIQTAIVGAISVFACMFAFGLGLLTFGISLTSRFGIGIFISLLVLILVQIVSIFTGTMKMLQKVFAFIGLIIFSIYIIYDTNRILQRNYYGDFITASMDYYLDIINIFIDILTLNTNPLNR